MHNQKGFCLISFLIYALCSFFIVCIAIQWFICIHKTIIKQLAHSQALIELHIVHDLLVRDIKSAKSHKQYWYITEDKEFIFEHMQGDICIGWQLKDDLLIRREGRYDQHEKKWKDSSHVTILSLISYFSCLYTIKNEKIANLHVFIKMIDSFSVDGVVRTEQGVYTCLE